jgi:predicted ABC-type ATPase
MTKTKNARFWNTLTAGGNILMDKPTILVFAGPNGSGKSTLTSGQPIVGIYVNADDIKIHRGCSDLEAAQEAELIRENLLHSLMSFTFETVLSTERNIILLEKAKEKGYKIWSVFVLTADVELNIERVKARIFRGGHDVPADKIRSRYTKSLQMLKRLVDLSDTCVVVDNTKHPEIIYKKDEKGEVYLSNDFWDEPDVRALLAI